MFGFVRPAACRSSAPRSVTDGCPYPPLPCRAKNRNKIQLSSHRKQEINGNGGDSFHRSHELLPPLRRSPSLKEGGLGFRRSRPPALPSIAYRGFAVAPMTLRAPFRRFLIQPRVQGRNPARFKGGYGVPSGARLLLPPPTGRSPSLEEGGLRFRRSRPPALPSIAYRGFAIAPITLRAPSRNLVYNPGCRVETLLVSKGVMGFLGDLRGRNRNLPLIP